MLSNFSPWFLPVLFNNQPITEYQKRRKKGQNQHHTKQTAPANEMSQIPNRCCRRNKMHNVACQSNNRSRSKNRRTGAGNRLNTGLLFRKELPLCNIVVSQQNRIIHSRAQLNTADNDIAHIHHIHTLNIRNRHIQENCHLNRNHDHKRNQNGMEAEHNNHKYAQQRQHINPGIVFCNRNLNILSRRSLPHHIGLFRIIFLHNIPNLIRTLESNIAFSLCSYVYQHPGGIVFVKKARS